MKRALLPIILVFLGSGLIMWASSMPLFEWQISSLNEDYPPGYEVYLVPSPWIIRLGETLDNIPYLSRKVFISIDQKACWIEEGHKITIERSTNDRQLDLLSSKLKDIPLWLFIGSLILVVLSVMYMWWILIWCEHRTIAEAVALTITIVFIISLPIGMMRWFAPRISTDYFFGLCHGYRGMISFGAEISKVHYEMLLVTLSGVIAEFGALGKMLHEIIGAVRSSKLVVG